METTKVVVVYYSRTGYTERVVNELKLGLASGGFTVDVCKLVPLREYSKPLHVNPRLIYDTIIRKGTKIKFESKEPRLDSYDLAIVASPVWIGTLSSPIQEFLRKYASKRPLVVITTSIQRVKAARIERMVEKLCGAKPLLCVNIRDVVIKEATKLKETIQDVIKMIKATTERVST